jgi:hypothetical protein
MPKAAEAHTEATGDQDTGGDAQAEPELLGI